MNGSALAFSFLTLFAVIGLALSLLGLSVAFSIENGFFVLFKSAGVLGFLACLNAIITYGLKRKKLWAIYIGAIEMSFFLLSILFDAFINGFFSVLIDSWFSLLIIAMLFSILGQDYGQFKASAETYV